MHPSRLATNTTIWTLAFVLQCALVYVAFRRGVARRFPIFGSMLVFYPIRAALLFGLSGFGLWAPHIQGSLASSLYTALSFADLLLQLMVAVELALHLIRGLGGWTRLRALLCLLLLGAACVFTCITLSLLPNRIAANGLQIFAWFALPLLLGVVLKSSRSPNLTRISAGLAVSSLMQLSALAGRTVAFLHRNTSQYVAWSYVPALGYLAIVIFWLVTLRKESEQIPARHERSVARTE